MIKTFWTRLHDVLTQVIVAVTLGIGLSACRHSVKAATPEIRQPPLSVFRATARIDSAQLIKNVGSISVVGRSSDHPTQNIAQLSIQLIDQSGKELARVQAAGDSAVTLENLPPGFHLLLVQRLGYNNAQFRVAVSAGCRTDIEAYLTMMAIGLDAFIVKRDRRGRERAVSVPPARLETPARATITECDAK